MSGQKIAAKALHKEIAAKQDKVKLPLFEKDNFLWMGIGAAIIKMGAMVIRVVL